MKKWYFVILAMLISGNWLNLYATETEIDLGTRSVQSETETETPTLAPGIIVRWSENSHFYTYIDEVTTWKDAASKASTFLDGTGYLATVTTHYENQFLLRSFGWPLLADCWIGGIQDTDIDESDPSRYAEGWSWINGEVWDYTNWDLAVPEPNNVNGGEEYLQFVDTRYEPGRWNDENVTGSGTSGYVIEWEHDPRKPETITLTGVIRDFNDSHPDFESFRGGSIDSGIVETTLGEDGKPVFNSSIEHNTVTTAENFYQWFHDVPEVNQSKEYEIVLTKDPESEEEYPVFTWENANFFPIDDELFGNQDREHNYHFTCELHTYFTYTGPQEFTFKGDDDLWVFINNELVIDLGGSHSALSASVNTGDLGLDLGRNYRMDIFFAERHTVRSHMKIQSGVSYIIPPALLVSPVDTATPTPTPTPTNTLTPTPTPTNTLAPAEPAFTLGGGVLTHTSGNEINVPIKVANLPPTTAISFEVIFDTSVLSGGEQVVKSGTLLERWGLIDAYEISEGRLRVVGAALSGRSARGSGTLIYLKFRINRQSASNSRISRRGYSYIRFSNLEDGVAEARPIPVRISLGMKGDVDGNGRITASDVQWAFQIALGRKDPTEYQRWAAEVTGDDKITASDVQRIFQATLGRVILTSTANKAVTAKRSVKTTEASSLEVGHVSGAAGESVMVPLHVNPGSDLSAILIDLDYDTSKLSFVEVDKAGSLLEDFPLADAYEMSSGHVRISAAALTAEPINQAGVLVHLRFDILENASGSAAISIQSTDDDLADATTVNGAVQINTMAHTPTPTPTPQPPQPTPTPRVQHIFIYDSLGDNEDLTGQTDFDPADERELVIAWDAEQGGATDWHVYVRKGFGGSKYLGRTDDGSATSFVWTAGAGNLAPEFANGPDFNAAYTFRVIRVDGQLEPEDYFNQYEPVGFNIEGGNEVSLAQPEIPYLDAGQVVIYDDILGGKDLASMGSFGPDTDKPSSRAIQVAWNFGRNASTVNEYHVMVKVDGGEYEFLGQTFNGNINYFWWTPNNEFKTNPDYAEGPQDGHTYQFQVYLSPLTGDRVVLTSGVLDFSVEQ